MSGLLVVRRGIMAKPTSVPFVRDTFTDTAGTALASHTGETGATWVKAPGITGSASINASGLLYCSAAGTTAVYYASGVPATAEYDVECTVTQVATGSTTTAVGVVGRLSTSANPGTDYHWTWASATGLWTLVERNAGSSTTLASFADTWTTGVPKTIKLQIRDAAKKAFVDGIERASSATNVITATGRPGCWVHNNSGASTAAWQIDNLTATNA